MNSTLSSQHQPTKKYGNKKGKTRSEISGLRELIIPLMYIVLSVLKFSAKIVYSSLGPV